MPDILMRKAFGALRPVDEQGEESLRGIPNGAVVKVTVKRPRNIRHHRLYWALMSLLHENQSRYATVEELSDAIKCAVGHCTVITRPDGTEIRIPRSISFSKMDQDAFKQFFDRVVELAVSKILPNVEEAELRREVEDLVRLEAA